MACEWNEMVLEQLRDEGEELGLEGEQLEHYVEEQFEMRGM